MSYRSLLIVCLATLGLAIAGWGQAGGKIAFISGRDFGREEHHHDVWIMNADGSDPVNLTKDEIALARLGPRMARRSPILATFLTMISTVGRFG